MGYAPSGRPSRRRPPTHGRTAMPWRQHVLVIANQTVDSAELRAELRSRSRRAPTTFTLLVPARGSSDAEERLSRAVAELRSEGLDVLGRLAEPDPFLAVADAWDPKQFDEILVSTLPTATSRWLGAGLPNRIERHTGALVSVVSARGRPATPRPAARHPSPARS